MKTKVGDYIRITGNSIAEYDRHLIEQGMTPGYLAEVAEDETHPLYGRVKFGVGHNYTVGNEYRVTEVWTSVDGKTTFYWAKDANVWFGKRLIEADFEVVKK